MNAGQLWQPSSCAPFVIIQEPVQHFHKPVQVVDGHHLNDCGNFTDDLADDNTPAHILSCLLVWMQGMHGQWGHTIAETIMRFAALTSTKTKLSADRPLVMLLHNKQNKSLCKSMCRGNSLKPADVPWLSGEGLCSGL